MRRKAAIEPMSEALRLDAHQKRYCWRRVDVPRISEAAEAEKQVANDSTELPAAA